MKIVESGENVEALNAHPVEQARAIIEDVLKDIDSNKCTMILEIKNDGQCKLHYTDITRGQLAFFIKELDMMYIKDMDEI